MSSKPLFFHKTRLEKLSRVVSHLGIRLVSQDLTCFHVATRRHGASKVHEAVRMKAQGRSGKYGNKKNKPDRRKRNSPVIRVCQLRTIGLAKQLSPPVPSLGPLRRSRQHHCRQHSPLFA